jgi:chlorite dismutase
MSGTHGHLTSTVDVDVSEHGAPRDGAPQAMNRRLFMQLLAFETAPGTATTKVIASVGEALGRRKVASVLYADANHPTGFGLLTFSEDPATFVARVRPALEEAGSASMRLRPELTMLGRTYSSGYEADLEYWLLRRPRETALNESWPWAVWYPLRRSGAFERLEPKEKGGIMREHAEIGKAYGAANLAHDIRLACHGLDANDNEFVIGLVGQELHPLSHVVQAMRRTRQTSEFIVQMGPFFVGHAVHRTDGD